MVAIALVGLRSGHRCDGNDAGIASGGQRAADQLGGATGITVYVGIGFAPAVHGDPFLVSSALAVAGLVAAGLVTWPISVR